MEQASRQFGALEFRMRKGLYWNTNRAEWNLCHQIAHQWRWDYWEYHGGWERGGDPRGSVDKSGEKYGYSNPICGRIAFLNNSQIVIARDCYSAYIVQFLKQI